LSDCLAQAARQSPALAAAFYRWQGALQRAPQAKALPDPVLGYTYFYHPTDERGEFTVMQMFPWFGKLDAAAQAAAAEAQMAFQEYQQQRLALFYDVKRAYGEYYYLAAAAAATEETLGYLQSLEPVVRTRYAAGGGSQTVLLRLQVEIGRTENDLRSLRDQRAPAAAQLNALLNRPLAAALAWPSELPGANLAVPEEQVLALLPQRSPELAALAAQIEQAGHEARLAEKGYYPDFSVGLMYMDMRAPMMESQRHARDPVGLMFSLNLPLNRGKYDAAVREALARQHAARAQRADRQNLQSAQASMALYGWRDARRRVDLYARALIPRVREALAVTQQAFTAGQADFLDLVDGVRNLLEFQLARQRARADQAARLAELEMLVGAPLAADDLPGAFSPPAAGQP